MQSTGADAIGMSGLLVKSTLIMRDNLEVMNERGIKVPVVLGGAALTRRYVEEDLHSLYHGDLFYAKDAFDGLHVMDVLTGTGSAAVASNERARCRRCCRSGVAQTDTATAAVDDAEDLVGEDAKLGIRKPAQAARRPRRRRRHDAHRPLGCES